MDDFLRENWFWIVFLGLFIWMHCSGMGCGGHRHGGKGERHEGGHGH